MARLFAVVWMLLAVSSFTRRIETRDAAKLASLSTAGTAVTEPELEQFFRDSDGLSMMRSDAARLAQKEVLVLTKIGITVEDLAALRTVLYSGIFDLTKAALREQLLPLAKQHVDPEQLKSMSEVLYKDVDLMKSEVRIKSVELVKQHAEPKQVRELFDVLYNTANLFRRDARQKVTELGAAGCDATALKSSFTASKNLDMAIDSAIRANLNGAARRYAKDGNAYTASEFQSYFPSNYLKEWLEAPLEKKVAQDGKAYTASEFRMFFKDNWESLWHHAAPATQGRIAEDGIVYSIQEFASYYKLSWQQQWASAPEVRCKECWSR